MARRLSKILTIFVSLFIAAQALSITSQESHRSPDRWREWQRPPSQYKANLWKGKVIRFKRSSWWPRQPYEFGGPILFDGHLYAGNRQNMFYAVSIKPREKVWSFKTKGPVETRPLITNDTVYFGDSEGMVYALRRATGEEIWTASLGEPVSSAPAMYGNSIYIVSASGRLYAIDMAGGKERWHSKPFERAFGFTMHGGARPIVTAAGRIIMGTQTGAVVAYTESGAMAWNRQLGNDLAQVCDAESIATDGKNIYVAVADGSVAALKLANGNIVWSTAINNATSLAVKNDRLYVSGGNTIYAFYAESGLPIWELQVEGPGLSSPAVGDDFVAVSSTKDALYILDPKDGDIMLRRYLRGGAYSHPLADGERLYVLSNASRLYSFKVKRKERKKK